MKTRDMQFLESLRSARQFLAGHAQAFAAVNATGASKDLDIAIDRIATLSEVQDAHRINAGGQVRNAGQQAAAFRRKHLRPVVAICHAKLPDEPSLAGVTLPDARLNITELVQRGRAVAEAVQPFAQVFIDAGLAPDFIAQLQAAGEDLIKIVTKKAEHRSGRRGATDGLGKAVKKARRAVRVLDAMVQAKVPLEEPLVTEWRSAIRVIRGGRGPTATVSVDATRQAA